MLIGSRKRPSTLTDSPTLSINDVQISQVTTAKPFGVIIDDKLDKLTTKVTSGVGTIKRTRHLVPQATLHLIYRALVHSWPHFDYSNTVWGNCRITSKISYKNYKIKHPVF